MDGTSQESKYGRICQCFQRSCSSTCLRAISEGSIRFTLQAENISALEALWQRYQNETLQTEMQKFLVTEEIKQLAGGEVTLTVHIDEEEYRNAMCDFIRSGTEGIWT